MKFKSTPIEITHTELAKPQINISMDVSVLAKLIAEGHLCATDLKSLDKSSHKMMTALLLDVCANQFGGLSKRCDECESQSLCQKLGSLGLK